MPEKLPPKAARLQQAFTHLQTAGKVADKEAFAKKLGKSYSHMSSVFNGNRELTEDMAYAIEKAYGIAVPWLLLNVGDMHKKTTSKGGEQAMMKLLLSMANDLSEIKEKLGITTPT